jgi:ArsR family transcriptional regulator, arsenate/arsenite/antimonite-responsive transcriptional repressor
MHKEPFIKGFVMRSPRAGGWTPAGRPHATDLSVHFEGLANPTRLKIVERLAAAAEVRVSELAEFCKVSQPRMSWHLRILRRAQVIRTRRDGREVFCRLDREAIAAHMRSFVRLVAFGTQGGGDAEVQQLISEVAQ